MNPGRWSGRNVRAELLTAGFIAVLSGTLLAQNQESEEIYLLSPFVVDESLDDRYRSTNSTSGTSLDTRILDLPMSIEVINAEFLEDTGATDFEEALAYSSGVFLEEFTSPAAGLNTTGANTEDGTSADLSPSSRGGVNGRFSNATIIRGFNVPFQNRDGFRYGGLLAQYGTILGGVIDTSNIERMEVVRGPNSLLYGIGVLSGIVNVIPKRPLSSPVQKLSVGMGSEGFWRGTLDVTGPLSKTFLGGELDYRVAATFEERDHWTDWRGKELEYYVGQLQWQNEKMSLLLEGQYADQREKGIGDQHIHDNLDGAVDPAYRNEFGERYNWTKSLGGLPESYRITGPDTYHDRNEEHFLANLDISPIENLTLSAGIFKTSAREEEFNVNIGTLTNSGGSFNLKGVLFQRPNDPNTENPQEIQDWLNKNVTVFPNDHLEPIWRNGALTDLSDYRAIGYWWEKKPKTIESEQYRIRMTYNFESQFLGRNAKHTFLVARHDIKDEVDLTLGDSSISWHFADKRELADDDPLMVRNIHDHNVIRYQGEPLGIPGDEFRKVEVWFTGHYALYQGQLWNDKVGLILGARHDRFHSRDRDFDRFDEFAAFGSDYDGQPLKIAPPDGVVSNPDNRTYGFFPLPEGVSEYIPHPDKAETTTTKTFALNYKLRDDLILYGVKAEGLTPNTGERDGNLQGIPSEKSTSEEWGLKFDLMDGKLSGTLSAYRIKRENALWALAVAPAPAKWAGGIVHPTAEDHPESGFNPDLIVNGNVPPSYGLSSFYFENEGIELGKVTQFVKDDTGQVIGRKLVWPDGLLNVGSAGGFNPYGNVFLDYTKLDQPAIDKSENPTGKTWRHYLERALADTPRWEAWSSRGSSPDNFQPLVWNRVQGETFAMNSSQSQGASVTYTDEATGYDLQLVYSPSDHWQLIFNYAHTEREAITPFNLVDAVDPATGVALGTEYDAWILRFGREAFGLEETDTDGDGVVDQVTKNGQRLSLGDASPKDMVSGLQGLSLYSGAEDTASLWTKYSLKEGFLDGLGIGLGVIYTGPAETSVPFGGSLLLDNPYRTPPTKERYQVNTAFSYRWMLKDTPIHLRLNVYNLLDEQKGQTIVQYNDNGTTRLRRTDVYYAPRSYRLSLSVNF